MRQQSIIWIILSRKVELFEMRAFAQQQKSFMTYISIDSPTCRHPPS
jgi:hypothetical protein